MEFLKKIVFVILIAILFICCGKNFDNSNTLTRWSTNSVDSNVYWTSILKNIDTSNIIYLECFNNNVSDTAKNYVWYLAFNYSDTTDQNFLSNAQDANEWVLYTGEKNLCKDSTLLRVNYDETTGNDGFLIVPLNPLLVGKEIFKTSRTGQIFGNKKQSIWLWLGEKDSKLSTKEILWDYDNFLKVKGIQYHFW